MDLAASLQALHERVEFDQKKHSYRVNGQNLVSVTTVVGDTLAKGQGFLGWIAKVSRDGQDWRKVGKEEADKGKAVHRTVENWARRRLGLPDLPEIASAEAAYLCSGLAGFLDASGIVPVFQPEVRLHHASLLYGGTMDLPCFRDGHPTIVDIKTCKKADDQWDEWPLQLGGYCGALLSNGLGAWRRSILRVPKDGGAPNFLDLDPDPTVDFEAFKSLLAIYHWRRRKAVA